MSETPQLSRYPGESRLIEMMNKCEPPLETTGDVLFLLNHKKDEYLSMMRVISKTSIERKKGIYNDIKSYPNFEKFCSAYKDAVKTAETKKGDDFKKWMFEEKMGSLVENKYEKIIEQLFEKYNFAILFITPDCMYRLGKDGMPITLEGALNIETPRTEVKKESPRGKLKALIYS